MRLRLFREQRFRELQWAREEKELNERIFDDDPSFHDQMKVREGLIPERFEEKRKRCRQLAT